MKLANKHGSRSPCSYVVLLFLMGVGTWVNLSSMTHYESSFVSKLKVMETIAIAPVIETPSLDASPPLPVTQPAAVGLEEAVSTTRTTQHREPQASAKDGPKFAVAYIVAGCTHHTCLGYILNVITAATILKAHNSTSDVVFQVRMSSSTSPEDSKLPEEHTQWLEQMGVKLSYLPQVADENFGTATLEKFRVLEMTDYDRVYFLDADLTPRCNIDYHMQASYDGTFQPYVGNQGGVAPINAGNFIVTPKAGLFGQVMDLIHAKRNANQGFNVTTGWGHTMDPRDPWKGYTRSGDTWDMLGSQIDQGLLYHLFKYELLNWTHWKTDPSRAESWQEVPAPNDSEIAEQRVFPVGKGRYIAPRPDESNPFTESCAPPLHSTQHRYRLPPHGDFDHFGGDQKPWKHPIKNATIPDSYDRSVTMQHVWLYWLGVANRTYDLQLPSRIFVSTLPKKGGNLMQFKSHDLDQLLRPEVGIPLPREAT